MRSWHELQTRLKTKTAIAQINQDLLHLEEQHWRRVIHIMIAISCHFAEGTRHYVGIQMFYVTHKMAISYHKWK